MNLVRQCTVLILGAALAFTLLYLAKDRFAIKTDELAFGTETANILGDVDGRVTHCLGADDTALCETEFFKANPEKTIFWMGNSQLPAINRFETGQENAPQSLFRALEKRGIYLATYSQPNANLSEHAVLINALMPKYQPDIVILPVVFDDIREQGIRPIIADFAKDPKTMLELQNSMSWPFVSASLASIQGQPGSSPSELGLEKENLQKIVERNFTKFLGENWSLWADRPILRGTALSAQHLLRNRLLGIHSYTKRSVNPNIYNARIELLSAIIADVKTSGSELLLYIPPYRDDIDGPYIKTQYDAFKSDLANIAKTNETYFLDLENTVAGPEWGTVTDRIFGFKEPDFMHFTEQGHIAFAQALNIFLEEQGY